jgi:hypothetical protein
MRRLRGFFQSFPGWLAAASTVALAGCGASGFGDRGFGTSETESTAGSVTTTGTEIGAGGYGTTGGGGAPGGTGAAAGAKADPRRPYASLCSDAKTCTPGLGQCLSPTLDAAADADGCSLVPADGVVVGSCGPNGDGEAGQPCNSAADCAAGLGCVTAPDGGAAAGGVCRPYCCQDVEACPEKTFCSPLPMAEDTVNSPRLAIPVCAPATNCQLLDDLSCPEGLTCSIVRADGTTTCVAPGAGVLGEHCPCAAGFVCAKLTDECKKLCHLGQDEVDCPNGGTCQGGSQGYPDGIGLCVGGTSNQY